MMRKTKSYCPGCYKPKKMVSRQTNPIVGDLHHTKTAQTKALSIMDLGKTKSLAGSKDDSVENNGRVQKYIMLGAPRKEQEFTLY